jgi:hypothetical protein
VEQQVTNDIATIGNAFDQATLNNRLNQLSQVELDVEKKMDDFQSTVQHNNELAAQVHGSYVTNVNTVNGVKQSLSGLIQKMSKYSASLQNLNTAAATSTPPSSSSTTTSSAPPENSL